MLPLASDRGSHFVGSPGAFLSDDSTFHFTSCHVGGANLGTHLNAVSLVWPEWRTMFAFFMCMPVKMVAKEIATFGWESQTFTEGANELSNGKWSDV